MSTLSVNQYIAWEILTRCKSQGPSLWSREDGLFVVLLWISMSQRQLYTACAIATMRQGSSQGGLDKVVEAWQPHRMTDIWPSVPFGVVQQLLQDLRRVTGVTMSDQTVRNRLREVSLRPIRPIRVPRLTQQHRAARLLFVRSHVNWQLRQWRPVLFTDESRFPLTQHDGQYGDDMVSSICQMLSRKATDSHKVLWWCGVASVLMAVRILSSSVLILRCGEHRADTATPCVGWCTRCLPWIRTHARELQGSYRAHHQSCLARTGHSRDGMANSEPRP